MSAFDRIERLGGSRIQHGPANGRVYLMHLDPADLPAMPDRLLAFARERGYGKVFAKVPAPHAPAFAAAGYVEEASVPGYYGGETGAVFFGGYTDPTRAEADRDEVSAVRAAAEARAQTSRAPRPLPAGWRMTRLVEADAGAAAEIYRLVFETYPFPIHDPDYLRRTMDGKVTYYGIWTAEERLVALASAEKDVEARAAELTDFATRPGGRGRSLAGGLLARMERDLADEGFLTGYTIARALSHGMNITFARAGYRFGGTLWNNTQICGRLESMNVWHRPLTGASPTVTAG